MKCFQISNNKEITPILVENTASEGVKRIATKVAGDIELVCGLKPSIYSKKEEINTPQVIIFATMGQSEIMDYLSAEGKIDTDVICGKQEVYSIKLVENPIDKIKLALVICGSDKRGTIYGMFHLSELLGVSPMVFWGDAKPAFQSNICLDEGIEMVSKEPSVKYRGFFINDEWPCFGNWAFGHYGGFNAVMYDKVFELLLRLKGNYLWPAMWTSSFQLDGPGLANMELADIYGVIMGTSHHEPCMRASEEWDKVRGEDSIYGNEWNYYTNKEGLLKYWRDGLIRGHNYESIITIGMRGERDSSMLDEASTLKENIDLLKDIIREQRKLIAEHVNPDLNQVPQMIALYKEVEDYFYGDRDTVGLNQWEELDGVICMLCEDNFGNLRTLPEEEVRNRKGGWGMYYHFDYHGGPISHEWVNSTPLSKVWEQMSMAYDYGIRDIWIVNVGDIKFNEFPLSYFLSLAYDFEKWGTQSPNSTEEFTFQWMKQQFGKFIDDGVIREIMKVHNGYIRLNSLRHPEALNEYTYHPVHEREADRMLELADYISKKAQHLYEHLPNSCKDAYYSMIYYPAMASTNLLKMQLYAGKNRHYAMQGKKIANEYAQKVTECIEIDNNLSESFSKALNGKWKGMELASHIGFTQWNDDNCRYPLRYTVEAAKDPRMVVSRVDAEPIAHKVYGSPMTIEIKDFLYHDNTTVDIEIANDGQGYFDFTVEMEPSRWLSVHTEFTTVESQNILTLCCDRSQLPEEEERLKVFIKGANATIVLLVYGKKTSIDNLKPLTFLANKEVFTINANNYCEIKNTDKAYWQLLEDFGRYDYGLKVFPTTKHFQIEEPSPTVTYRIYTEKGGSYKMALMTAPSNPVHRGMGIRYGVSVNGGTWQIIDSIADGFKAGAPENSPWAKGVLDNIRTSISTLSLSEGINEIAIKVIDPGLVLERLMIYPEDHLLPKSYLGPVESYYTS
ncbi:MAG: hypothetical protein GX288_02455 [Clostridiales bacterium]|nr:hypothetical protein [Clostridiales bacterium]